jgi:hypothetical protein
VSTHELLVSSNDLLGLGKTTILSKSDEKVGSDLGVLARLQELLNTLLLGCAVKGRVLKKSLDALVLGNNTLDLLEFLLNSIENILLSSSSIKSGGITTVQSEQSQRSLNEINERMQISQRNVMLAWKGWVCDIAIVYKDYRLLFFEFVAHAVDNRKLKEELYLDVRGGSIAASHLFVQCKRNGVRIVDNATSVHVLSKLWSRGVLGFIP